MAETDWTEIPGHEKLLDQYIADKTPIRVFYIEDQSMFVDVVPVDMTGEDLYGILLHDDQEEKKGDKVDISRDMIGNVIPLDPLDYNSPFFL